jgi:hypothetical protein
MAKLKHLEHEVIIYKRHGYEVESWCKRHFGERWNIFDNPEGRWTVFWAGSADPKRYRWCFADERDAARFALRWAHEG